MSESDSGAVAAAYVDTWKAGDWERLRSLLADDMTFDGPLASIEAADACLAGLQRPAEIRVTFDARPLAPPDS